MALKYASRPRTRKGGLCWLTYFTAEHAVVSRVLGDFHLLHELTERSTVTGTVLSGDTDLLGTFGHSEVCVWRGDGGARERVSSRHRHQTEAGRSLG
jgi:hypothetical protein